MCEADWFQGTCQNFIEPLWTYHSLEFHFKFFVQPHFCWYCYWYCFFSYLPAAILKKTPTGFHKYPGMGLSHWVSSESDHIKVIPMIRAFPRSCHTGQIVTILRRRALGGVLILLCPLQWLARLLVFTATIILRYGFKDYQEGGWWK